RLAVHARRPDIALPDPADLRALRDDQPRAGTLAVILSRQRPGHIAVLYRAVARQRRHYHPVPQLQRARLQRGEKLLGQIVSPCSFVSRPWGSRLHLSGRPERQWANPYSTSGQDPQLKRSHPNIWCSFRADGPERLTTIEFGLTKFGL